MNRGALLFVLVCGCGPRVPFAPVGLDGGPPPACEGAAADAIVCVGDWAYTCDGASATPRASVDCARSGRSCADGIGCLACVPGRIRCTTEGASEIRERCTEDGAGWQAFETCDAAAGLRCSADGCADLCAEAEAAESYIGCEYTPVTLRNSVLSGSFTFAVSVANPQLVPAAVTIEGGALEAPIALRIPPSGLEVVELPWIEALRGDPTIPAASVRVPGGAYRIRSDVPVTVTQFNPLRFRESEGCEGRDCFSFSNDASLLLPTHVLTASYLAITRPTHVIEVGGSRVATPGLVALVGVGDAPVDVEVRSRAAIEPGADLPAFVPGTRATFSLAPGEVVQLLSAAPTGCPGTSRAEMSPDGMSLSYCDPGPGFDLTGTEIRGSGPLAVFVGHDCTFVPFDRWACDHLEEQLIPVEALGNDAFLPVTEPLRAGEPNVVRIVSLRDGNTIRLEPPLVEGEAPRTIDRGEFFEIELSEARWARGSGPLLGAVFLVGQNYGGLGAVSGPAVGDPAMALVVPSAQFRDRYDVLTPATYERSAATVAAPRGARVVIDDRLVELVPVPGTTMGLGHVDLLPGTHAATGNTAFGLYLTGYASYTSYFVPGGMDFEPIAPPF